MLASEVKSKICVQPTSEQLRNRPCKKQRQDDTGNWLAKEAAVKRMCECHLAPLQVCRMHDVLTEEQLLLFQRHFENETWLLQQRPAVDGCLNKNGACTCRAVDPFGHYPLAHPDTTLCPKHDIYDVAPKKIPHTASEEDLKNYHDNKRKYFSLDDYTVLLIAAINFGNVEVVKSLLDGLYARPDFSTTALLNVDANNDSPLSSVLGRGNTSLLAMMRGFIYFRVRNKRLAKAECMEKDNELTIVFLLEHPQFDDTVWDAHAIFKDFFEPLFWNTLAIQECFERLGFNNPVESIEQVD